MNRRNILNGAWCPAEIAKRAFLLILLTAALALITGCVVLYMPDTYYFAQTSDIVAPFDHLFVEYGTNAPEAPLEVSLEDSDSSKLKHSRFFRASMTNEDGVVTQLSLHREILENPNSLVMNFYKADYLGHDLHFRISVISNGKTIVVTFQTRFKSKVHWPKDSDYSG